MIWHSRFGKIGGIIGILLLFSLIPIVAATDTSALTITVMDARTSGLLDGARIYLDGGYVGTTASGGAMGIPAVNPGAHTVRVTLNGYNEITKKISAPADTHLDIMLSPGSLVPLSANNPRDSAIDIIFYPSSTSYNCANHEKISDTLYLSDESRFRNDVMNIINNSLINLASDSSARNSLPDNIQERFNFYYYYDPAAPADAFSGCAGTVPEKYWNEVSFSDVTIILYPSYQGIYADTSCQPTGCFQDFGPGRSLMKVPADQINLFKHENGHAVFGLVDTYCGETYYYENDPHANVWTSLDLCKADARSNSRDPAQCRQIQKQSQSVSCSKNYWVWDPQPDIMAGTYGGKFGEAATQRISYVLSEVGGERS